MARPDYRRFACSLVKLQTFEPVAGNRHWQGRLTQITEHAIVLDLSAVRQREQEQEESGERNGGDRVFQPGKGEPRSGDLKLRQIVIAPAMCDH